MTKESLKEKVLKDYDTYLKMSKLPEIVLQKSKLDKTSNSINRLLVSTNSSSGEIEILTQEHNDLKEKYNNFFKTGLTFTFINYPEIYEKIIDGIERELLQSVLDVFEKYTLGLVSKSEAAKISIQYMNRKFNLPHDFLVHKEVEKLFSESE